jgi:hypothetical protein
MKVLINMISLFQAGPKTVALGYLEGIADYVSINNTVDFLLLLPNVEDLKARANDLGLYNTCKILEVQYPFIKPRFIFKLFYDHIYTAYIAAKFNVNYIFMTANFASLFTRRKQLVLFHNIHYLQTHNPFSSFAQKRKYSLEKKLFFFTLRYKEPIYLVQLNCIKEELVAHVDKKRIYVHKMIPPVSDFQCKQDKYEDVKQSLTLFKHYKKLFLPAKFHPNKNFWLIVNLADYIFNQNLQIRIFLTLDANDYLFLLKEKEYLREIIINIGFINYSEIKCFYKNMDALLYPSISESYGFPIVEAVLSNIKVILPKTEFAEELIKENGYFFDINNFETLYLAVDDFITDKKEIFSSENFNFNWKSNIEQIINIFEGKI